MIELEAFQEAVRTGSLGFTVPDLLVVARDANCSKFAKAYKEVDGKIDRAVFPEAVIACPDPHVERWFMADPSTFKQVVGAEVRPGTRKCTQDLYKAKLAGAVARAEIPSTLGGVEFAHDLVNAMDLYRAGKREPSLKHFVSDLTEAAKRLAVRP